MWQNVIVGFIVLLAALYGVWYLLPGSLRQRLARFHPALGAGKSCGSCSSCGGCPSAIQPRSSPNYQPTEHVVKFHSNR